MISLQPREQFMLVRQLSDHTDPTTYYVQAVIKNSVSGATIATVRLIDGGNGRFTKLWEVPSDVSGLGFYIDITISVYSDSGYTTKASSYGDSNDQFLVFDRIVKHGGGGGMDVDYKKIEKILTSSIKPLLGLKNADLAPVLAQIKGVMMAVDKIEMPEMEKMNHTPVLKAIEKSLSSVLKAIDNKPVTEKTDLGEVVTKLGELLKKEPKLDMVFTAISGVRRLITDFIKSDTQRESDRETTSSAKLKKLAELTLPILNGEKPEVKTEPRYDERITRLFI